MFNYYNILSQSLKVKCIQMTKIRINRFLSNTCSTVFNVCYKLNESKINDI